MRTSIKWLANSDEAIFSDIPHLSSVIFRDPILSMVLGPVDSSVNSEINYCFNLVLGMLVHTKRVEGKEVFVLDLKRPCVDTG